MVFREKLNPQELAVAFLSQSFAISPEHFIQSANPNPDKKIYINEDYYLTGFIARWHTTDKTILELKVHSKENDEALSTLTYECTGKDTFLNYYTYKKSDKRLSQDAIAELNDWSEGIMQQLEQHKTMSF